MFSENSLLMNVLEKIADMCIASIIWVIFCIPLITIVPATIALYYTTVKVIRRNTGYVIREFWGAFIQNIRQGIFVEIIYIALGILCYSLHSFSIQVGLNTSLGKAYYFFSMGLGILAMMILLYLLPVLSRFSVSVFSAFRLAAAFELNNLKTVVPLLFTAAAAVVVMYLFPPADLIVPSAYCFLVSYSVEKVLTQYIEKNMTDAEENSSAWYMGG